ncbi:BirA family transcriptional regulator, biotin operon repressor / biotin-[acetyl-CoA-carboxylase] ligase [Amycolatopsis pretoriensis]|uniref:biotin--[biotin carboxyl-carrier protein] ligase n=1 Tax=Amycolatopsis pretoriensis TaxID=218821 RepID=A0A1H5RC87_9PSEU|nr:biotin--[acetyl-CoA-carboxylase] ligase [Amycolatopsis pretoriensis]SEF35980.1 BirA family transcriptional regulator, biotin operon repressor / biotin-[acetyl-CoA-carboxylase] ligase [Amycolatopsis pretoriensis]
MTEIDAARLSAALQDRYAKIDVVERTGSTNADLRKGLEDGAADRTVLLAEEQTAGVGRRARQWSSPKGAGLYLSVALRPDVPFTALGSLSVVAGLAVRAAAASVGVDAALKWPNDVLCGGAKCAGILAEAVAGNPPSIVLGIGLNVLPLGDVQPGPGGLPATSLAELGATNTDRTDVAIALLTEFDELEKRWRLAGGDLTEAGLLGDYRAHCSTLGQDVEVQLPDGTSLTGRAADIDAAGQLQVDMVGGQRHTVFAGDVVHVRPA